MKLEGGVALVTGGAHRVGKAIALALAHQGMRIALHYGQSAADAEVARAEIAALGVDCATFQADLADPARIDSLMASVTDHYARLDLLVNSAAGFKKQPFDAITAEDWDAVLAVNLRAPFLLSQRAARLMKSAPRQTPALIVNIADLSGLHPWLGYAHHAVSKAGLIHLTRVAARELAPDIRVNALVPGPILPPPGLDADSPRWREMIEATPLKQAGSPDDVGAAVVFLAENDFITGAILPVDGGQGLLGSVGH